MAAYKKVGCSNKIINNYPLRTLNVKTTATWQYPFKPWYQEDHKERVKNTKHKDILTVLRNHIKKGKFREKLREFKRKQSVETNCRKMNLSH